MVNGQLLMVNEKPKPARMLNNKQQAVQHSVFRPLVRKRHIQDRKSVV